VPTVVVAIIAARLAKGCRKDFDDPEDQGHFWHLAYSVSLVGILGFSVFRGCLR
jgi:hypothetical protein